MKITSTRIKEIAGFLTAGFAHARGGPGPGGLDALEVIPVPDLGQASAAAYTAVESGFIPERYGWTREKTEWAYRLKGYGQWARSVIVAAKYYLTDEEPPSGGSFGPIARFTWRNNYRYIVNRLSAAVKELSGALGRPIRSKILSNYTAVPEKALFLRSGLACRGKNSVLINERMGSYFAIGEAFIDIEVDIEAGAPGVSAAGAGVPAVVSAEHGGAPPGEPGYPLCGNCRRCIDACPTKAIARGGAVNVNRCFQYLSEDLLLVPEELRERWGCRLYGCSICIDACPLNAALEPWGEKHEVGFVGPGMDLLEALSLGDAEWRERFRDNQIGIRDRRAILKNALLSLGWLEYRKALDRVLPFFEHEHEILRACAVWAAGRIGTRSGKDALERLARRETSASVRAEIERAL